MMDFANILDLQRKFFNDGNTLPVSFRMRQLRILRDAVKKYETLLVDAVYKDFGKSEIETFIADLGAVYSEINWLLRHMKSLASPKKKRTNTANFHGKSIIISEPVGCVLIIGAWNYPYNLTLVPLVSALAAGCTAIIKPSELPVNSMKALSKMISETFESSFVFVAEGGVEETTQLLKLRFDKIFFTGSPRVGKIVYKAAAENLTPVTLELGGKSPAIVTPSADLIKAAKRIAWGKFFNAGQTCVAPDYVFVHSSVKSRFLHLLEKNVSNTGYRCGSEHYVSIINDRNFDRLVGLIPEDKVFYGGKYDKETRYIEPTILTDVSKDDKVMQEEIFGPILPILEYDEFEDVLTFISSRDRPLSAYLLSNSKKEKNLFLSRLHFGGGCINDTIMHLNNRHLPFGGIGNSGIGAYHGEYGFLCFSHQKSIFHRSNFFEPSVKYPPYSKWGKKILRYLLG